MYTYLNKRKPCSNGHNTNIVPDTADLSHKITTDELRSYHVKKQECRNKIGITCRNSFTKISLKEYKAVIYLDEMETYQCRGRTSWKTTSGAP